MSAESDISYGREYGLKVLRELVTSGARSTGAVRGVRRTGTNSGLSCPVRVVYLESGSVAEK